MLRNIVYTWIRLFRNKSNIFWVLAFPITLGTLFNLAFSNLGKAEHMSVIPVAIICEDDEYGKNFKETTKLLSEGENPLLEPTYCTEDEAMKLLKDEEITGIFYSGEEISLSISQNMATESLNQSILQSFVEEYNLKTNVITSVMKAHPEKIQEVLSNLEQNISYNKEVVLQKKSDIDTYIQYFYNQIAMACLYAAMAGIIVATENQANLSTLAARKNISATHKYKTIISELFASATFEFALNLIGFAYFAFILKVKIAEQLPYAIFALFIGVWTGVSLGYLIGSCGKKGKDTKGGIFFAIIMPMCFLSGLMIGNMRIIVDNYAPIINKINPAALISDNFYCLSIFEGHQRYTTNIISLLILSFLFTGIGIALTRRSKYASI